MPGFGPWVSAYFKETLRADWEDNVCPRTQGSRCRVTVGMRAHRAFRLGRAYTSRAGMVGAGSRVSGLQGRAAGGMDAQLPLGSLFAGSFPVPSLGAQAGRALLGL